jgi:hypothetical protein
VAAPAAPAKPQLIGSIGSGPIRFLDRDLNPLPGSPRVPRGAAGTLFSPGGGRIAIWGYKHRNLVVKTRRSGRVLTRRSLGTAFWVRFPSRNHVITVDSSVAPLIVRSLDIAHERWSKVELEGDMEDPPEQIGRVTRLLLEVPNRFQPDHFQVVDVGPDGKVEASHRIDIPSSFDLDQFEAVGADLSGDDVLLSADTDHALVRVDGPTTLLDLPDGYWSWAGRDFIFAGGPAPLVAKIDRDTAQVTKTIDADAGYFIPFRGGLIGGFGRVRYDADLNLLAENEAALPVFPNFVLHDRLYGVQFECDADDHATTGALVADAPSGKLIRRRGGEWKLGVLGAGQMAVFRDCD